MMRTDLQIPADALELVAGRVTSADAQGISEFTVAAFTGWEMAQKLLGGPLDGLVQVDPDLAAQFRGYLLQQDLAPTYRVTEFVPGINPLDLARLQPTLLPGATRWAVTLGGGKLIEPAGRIYVLTDYQPGRWGKAWAAPTILYQPGRLPKVTL